MEQGKTDVSTMDDNAVHIDKAPSKQCMEFVAKDEIGTDLRKTTSQTVIASSSDKKEFESDLTDKGKGEKKDVEDAPPQINGGIKAVDKPNSDDVNVGREELKTVASGNAEKTKEKEVENEEPKSSGDGKNQQVEEEEEESEEGGGAIPVPDSVRQCYYKFKTAWEACQEEINTSDNYEELVCQIAAGGDQLLPTCWRAVIEKMKECNHPESLNMVIDKNQKRAAKACKELREKQITPPCKDKSYAATTD